VVVEEEEVQAVAMGVCLDMEEVLTMGIRQEVLVMQAMDQVMEEEVVEEERVRQQLVLVS
jgi:hypothetical protein